MVVKGLLQHLKPDKNICIMYNNRDALESLLLMKQGFNHLLLEWNEKHWRSKQELFENRSKCKWTTTRICLHVVQKMCSSYANFFPFKSNRVFMYKLIVYFLFSLYVECCVFLYMVGSRRSNQGDHRKSVEGEIWTIWF